ncbi:MAG: BamA/TamA family outer membrane protein [Longimicrobiales bacterium]
MSLATLGGGSLRPNIAADAVTIGGVRAEIAGQLGSDVQKAVFNWRVWAEGAGGDADYGRVAATTRTTATPVERAAIALELAAGLAGNGAPVQRNFFLGGAATLRGVRENAVSGAAFWMARAEAGTALPGMRSALFVDVGWAGARDAVAQSRPTAGAGIGASVLDGLFRIDLARGVVRSNAWRVYFYLDALL